jgi:dolichol-phosphate mannosyltransferase
VNDPVLVSLVIPVHDEAQGLGANLPYLLERAATEGVVFEAVVVDDGSRDETAATLAALAAADPRIRPLYFTRNFGKEAAIAAGLDHARGAAAVVLDSDRQHPPELIPAMIECWRQGFPVVETVKRDRGDADRGGGVPAHLFYRLFSGASGIDLANQTDFKLLDRSVIDALARLPERHRFFRGLVAWMGYPAARLPFDVPPRVGGTTRWPLARLVRYAVDAMMGFSDLPLRLIGLIGAVVFVVGSAAGAIALFQKFSGTALDGFTTVIILLAIASGALMGALGIVGLYLARIHEQLQGRPLYLLRTPPEDGSR